MRVAEVFGPTFQGEGPAVGRRCGFVRLSGCDLACSWCDTPYTWDWDGRNGQKFVMADEMTRRTPADVVDEIVAMSVPMVVITGGEPLIQRKACEEMADLFTGHHGIAVWVETNGRHLPIPYARHVVSPKLPNAGDPDAIRMTTLVAHAEDGSHLKFVATTPDDLDEIAVIVEQTGFERDHVWVMPEGRDSATIEKGLRTLAPAVLDYGYNLSGRLHVTLWEDARAR